MSRQRRPPQHAGNTPLPDFVLSSRRFVHRAFARWYAVNGARFRIPLRFTKRNGDTLCFSFDGIQPAVTGFLNDGGFEVPVVWAETCVDLIWWGSNVAPQRDEHGWYCGLFLPEGREYYPTREALYVALAFETFLEWVNGTLATARWLSLYVNEDRMSFTAANVVRTQAEGRRRHGGCTVHLPLRFRPRQ